MNRIVLVTGGLKGIGKAISIAFAKSGDNVIVNYRKDPVDTGSFILNEDSSLRNKISFEQADVSDYSQVKRMVNNVINRHGRIDILINNAGIKRDGFLMLMSENDWMDVIDGNLKSVFNCSKAVTEQMISQRNGAIINISSLSGITGLPGQTNYAAAKGGVIAFTKALSKELAPFNIRVNTIAPGLIESDMITSLSDKQRTKYLENIPMKRFGKSEEVASVVKFIASEDASYITGETITVSGGLQ